MTSAGLQCSFQLSRSTHSFPIFLSSDERLSSFSHSSVVLEDSQLSSLMMLMMLQLLVMMTMMMTEVKQNKRFEAPGKP
jgi:hypothetical protein